MSPVSRSVSRPTHFPSRRTLGNGALVVAAAAAAVWLLFGDFAKQRTDDMPATAADEAMSETTSLELPATKLAMAGVETRPAEVQTLLHTHTVPGRIEYDATRRLELRLPADCIVQEVYVRPGQQVDRGEKLVLLTSEHVGLARDEVQQRAEDLRTAERELAWQQAIVANAEQLLASLAKRPDMARLESEFAERPLGEHRDELLGAYSDFLLAERVTRESADLAEGVLSNRTIQQRRNQLERMTAAFQGTCERTRHELQMELQAAEIAVARAERKRNISTEQLAALLGPCVDPAAPLGTSSNEFVISAPFAGGIEAVHVMPAAVVTANATLVTLADTDSLWVSAQIHERNWQAASVQPGQVLEFRTPATGDRRYSATVAFVGAVVDPETRALPLVATLENPQRIFKPGMFVWVSVPVEAERTRARRTCGSRDAARGRGLRLRRH